LVLTLENRDSDPVFSALRTHRRQGPIMHSTGNKTRKVFMKTRLRATTKIFDEILPNDFRGDGAFNEHFDSRTQ